MIPEHKINEIGRRFGASLMQTGANVLSKSFRLDKTEMTSQQFRDLLKSYDISQWVQSLYDQRFYTIPFNQMKTIIETDLIDQQTYWTDVFDCCMPTELAWTYGLFYADGACSLGKNNKYAGAAWRIVNSNKDYLERAKKALDWEYKELEFQIKSYPSYQKGKITNLGERKKTLYCLEATSKRKVRTEDYIVKSGKTKGRRIKQKRNLISPNARGKMIEDFKWLFYNPYNGKKMVPKTVMDKYPEPKKAFLEGVKAGDGRKTSSGNYITIARNNPIAVAGLQWLVYSLGWDFHTGIYEKEIGFRYTPSLKVNPVCACDNFAILFSARMALLHKINSVGWATGVMKDANREVAHVFNIIVATDGLYVLETQSDNWVKVEKGRPIIINGATYTISWVSFF